jgi:PEP-CTERM motif-containing protein
MKQFLKIVALSALLFGGLASASADTLVSLTPNLSFNLAGAGAPGDVITSTFNGTYFAGVYADPGNMLCANCLDFVYLEGNAGPGAITQIALSNFGSYSTIVGDVTNGVVAADFTSINGTITYDFTGANAIGANQTAGFLVIETNATAFQAGTVTISDGTNTFTGPGFQPIPEPATFTLLGTGLLGAVGVIRRKFAA